MGEPPGEFDKPLFYMGQKRPPPFRQYKRSQKHPYYAPFGGQYYDMTSWVPIGEGPPPNQLSFQWKNPQTRQGQGTSIQFHPITQLSSAFPPTN